MWGALAVAGGWYEQDKAMTTVNLNGLLYAETREIWNTKASLGLQKSVSKRVLTVSRFIPSQISVIFDLRRISTH